MMMPRAFASPLHSPSLRHGHGLPPPRHRRTLSSTLVDESVAAAAALVQKWHPADHDDDSPATARCSLFLRHDEEEEAQRFLRAAADLHRAMLFFASDVANSTNNNSHSGGGGHGLVQAQALLQSAMCRLDLELKLLLDHHDDDHDDAGTTTTLVQQLQAVAQAMMGAGYGKECVSTFRSHRRTALATKLQRLLGFSLSPPPAVGKLAWETVDANIIPSWLAAAPVAFNSLFAAEKDLCDAVFISSSSSSDAAAAVSVRDAVFAAIANEQATGLLAVAEAVVARAKRAPERLFRVLDVHDALTQALPALLSVFSSSSSNNNNSEAESESEVATRAAAVVTKVAHAVRATLSSFEAAIHKEPAASKSATSAGGAVHPLTRYVMNYLVFLADYQEGLALIYDVDDDQHEGGADDEYDDDTAATSSPASSPSSSRSMSSFPNPTTPPIHRRLVSALMGKLEAKAGCYREVVLSYLFLANNTHYVGNKVAGSRNLQAILGDAWGEAHMAKKARAHVDVYVRAAWGNVIMSATSSTPPHGHGQYGSVSSSVEEAVMEAVGMQEQWAAADEEMAEALRLAATAAVVPKYRMFYRRHGAAVRLTPGDVTTMIAALFGGPLAGAGGQRSRQPQRCTEVVHRQEDHPNPRRPHHLST